MANAMTPADLTKTVKDLAAEAGFHRSGVAPAEETEHFDTFRQWLHRGWHAEMAFLARHQAKRRDPRLLVPGARSVLCLAVPYAPPPGRRGGTHVARYARGRDYHKVLKRRCHTLMDRIRQIEPSFVGRAFVDTGPVMERALAAAAGLGWIGRNGCLLVPGLGSYVLLAEIISNLPLQPDGPIRSECLDCRKCVLTCPTAALDGDGLLDARKCISYLTIEHRGPIEPQLWPAMGTTVFGCDICQVVCPHNRHLPTGDDELLQADSDPSPAEILSWTPDDWDRATRGRALRRARWPMLLRNAVIAAGNTPQTLTHYDPADPPEEIVRLRTHLRRIRAEHEDLRDLATWALRRMSDPTH